MNYFDKIISWAKKQYKLDSIIGQTLKLFYTILVNPIIQSAISIIASILLGIFLHKNQNGATILNIRFLILFSIGYLLLIIAMLICNYYRGMRNNVIKMYEISHQDIQKALLIEYRRNYGLLDKMTPSPTVNKLNDILLGYDTFTESSFFIADSVYELLEKCQNATRLRVSIYLRTTDEKDTYTMVAYSPICKKPATYGEIYNINDFKKPGIRKKDIPVHAEPFLNKGFERIILLGSEVRKRYRNFNSKKPTKLHISIPAEIEGTVFLVLQITSYDLDWVPPRSNIEDLIDSDLMIYMACLKIAYMHQIIHERIALQYKKLIEEDSHETKEKDSI